GEGGAGASVGPGGWGRCGGKAACRTSPARLDKDKRLLSKAMSAATTKLLDEVGLSPDLPLAPALRGGAPRPVLPDPPRQLGAGPRGRPRASEGLELLQLASALEAVAMLGGEERPPGMDAKVAICAGGYDLVAVSSAPDPIVEGLRNRKPA